MLPLTASLAVSVVTLASTAVEWRLVVPRTSYNVREGIMLRIPVMLEERVTPPSSSVLVQQQGVFSVGVQMARLNSGAAPSCQLRSPTPAVPDAVSFFDFNEGPFAAYANVNASGSEGVLVVFARDEGVTGSQVAPGIRRVMVGEFLVGATQVTGVPEQFRVGDPSSSTDTLLWVNGQSIDVAIASSTISILVVPGCDSIDFNRNTVFPEDQDVIDFLSVLAGGPCSTSVCSDIDFNNNGVFPEDQDVIDFFTVLAGGECPG